MREPVENKARKLTPQQEEMGRFGYGRAHAEAETKRAKRTEKVRKRMLSERGLLIRTSGDPLFQHATRGGLLVRSGIRG